MLLRSWGALAVPGVKTEGCAVCERQGLPRADTQAEPYMQTRLQAGGAEDSLPGGALGLSSSVSHTQTHRNEGTEPLSAETQQGHFQFNGPSHLWIYLAAQWQQLHLLLAGSLQTQPLAQLLQPAGQQEQQPGGEHKS